MSKIIELDIHDLAFDGKAVGQHDGKIVFLNAGLPGERVRAEIIRRKARFDQARVLELLRRSPERIAPVCAHFDVCGGCAWQDLDYDQQLKFKARQVKDCLVRLGKLDEVEVEPILRADPVFFYRNKMEFSFHTTPDCGFTLGLHHKGKFDEIFDLTDCRLESEQSNRVVAFVRDFVAEHSIPVYNVLNHVGYMRFLIVREGKQTGQVMVNLVTNYGDFPHQQELVSRLTTAFPEITTIVHNQNGQKSNVATGEIEIVLFGPGYIEEKVLGKRFRIRANSFFQTNSLQSERLYEIALNRLNPAPDDTVLDLYCGAGSIGIIVSDRVKEVVGIELVPDAIASARENTELNDCHNISFIEGDVRPVLKARFDEFQAFTSIVIDPPRAGMHPRALKRIMELRARKLLYISCNPATFARDAALLVADGYRLERVRPVDMFPHTRHIELVGLFELN